MAGGRAGGVGRMIAIVLFAVIGLIAEGLIVAWMSRRGK